MTDTTNHVRGWKVVYDDCDWVLVLAATAQEARQRADREFLKATGYTDIVRWQLAARATITTLRVPALDAYPLGFTQADLVALGEVDPDSIDGTPDANTRMTAVWLTTEWG